VPCKQTECCTGRRAVFHVEETRRARPASGEFGRAGIPSSRDRALALSSSAFLDLLNPRLPPCCAMSCLIAPPCRDSDRMFACLACISRPLSTGSDPTRDMKLPTDPRGICSLLPSRHPPLLLLHPTPLQDARTQVARCCRLCRRPLRAGLCRRLRSG
jgi:hypothetical protein